MKKRNDCCSSTDISRSGSEEGESVYTPVGTEPKPRMVFEKYSAVFVVLCIFVGILLRAGKRKKNRQK